jgi:hypothetical protein
MPSDPFALKPGEILHLVNSTPIGTVLSESRLRRLRNIAGQRIGSRITVNLVKFAGWLLVRRHQSRQQQVTEDRNETDSHAFEAARGSAATLRGNGNSSKYEPIIAALLSEPTNAAAAKRAGISEATLYRKLNQPDFRLAYDLAKRDLLASSIDRLQAGAIDAVRALMFVARKGRRESDRVRAAHVLLEHSWRGLDRADVLRPSDDSIPSRTMDADDLVHLLTARLCEINDQTMPVREKSRLTASVGDALLRALGIDLFAKRLAAVEQVLKQRMRAKQ